MEAGFHAIDSDWCRIAFQRAPAPLVVCDSASLRILGANACASTTYGFDPGEWADTELLRLFEPADHDKVRAAVATAAREGEAQLPALPHLGKHGPCLRCRLLCYRLNCDEPPLVMLAMQDHSEAEEARARLSHLEDVLGVSQEVTGLGCCCLNLTTARLTWSAQLYKNLGLEPDSVMPSIEQLLAPVHPDQRPRFAQAIERCIVDGEAFDTDLRLTWPDGSEHVLRATGHRIAGDPQSPDWFACSTVDITEQRRLRDQLLMAEADLRHAQEIAHIGTWSADLRTGLIETTSAETYRIFRIDPEGADRPFTLEQLFRRIHPEDVPGVAEAREHTLNTPGARYDHRYRIVQGDHEMRYVHSQADVVRDENGKPVRIVGIIRDVTDLTRAEQEIERLAFQDEVTGLPNRVAMRRHLDEAFGASQGLDGPVAVLTVELARFRDINLTLGHLNGDDLLRDVARRLRTDLGDEVHLARTGNAQFIAVLRGVRAYHAGAVAETIARVFESTFLIAGVRYEISPHVGIALAPGHARNPTDLLRKADVAVHLARQGARKTMMYDPAQDPYDPQRLVLLGQFRNAIAEGQIELFCQPKVAMASGEVIGVEALARWRHPQLGMVPPAEFVPLIESTELIHALTTCMLQSSVRQSHAWRQDGLALPIAVNLSARNLASGTLPGDLRKLLAGWDAAPDWLGLEITESSLIVDPDASIAQLNALSGMGFRLFIDDFGTGYSSLNYLTMLPVDVIKIDHGFTTNMLRDRRAGAIVKATIDLAHDLGLSVVAEGTATREIWDALLACGCDEAQGYYVAPPLPAAELPGWMRQHALRHRRAGTTH
ncbi:bifunctional diguanylate cyclase/phosphodiesterase [Massilia sp. ST3]|uniref:putative bifunctional diguanylate cyclase/phosphodiesterase n=1 Tax=Massilia sp. ST3 TaxID=2824903 RepID=UPI001B84222C|nr:GGDEF domain-containing phosphodiesterase [Massilia sp. ST3]MBQ5946105.1 EAL domain-containing protein [Massilia sp. ST3]